MKGKDQGGFKRWLRLTIFLLVAGGMVWYLSGLVSPPGGKSEVKGEKEEVIPPAVKEKFNVLGERVVEVVPEEWRQAAQKTVEERIFHQTEKLIEENEVMREVREVIDQTTAEITGFPEKQKKEIKREVIKQVCQELLEKVEEE